MSKILQGTDADQNRVKQAVATGICPACRSPMIPNKDRTAASCSSNCGFGVTPNCETYAPAEKIAKARKASKAISLFPVATKTKEKWKYRINGVLYEHVRSVGIRQAKSTLRRKQLALLSDDVRPAKSSEIELKNNQIVAAISQSKLAIFEKVQP